MSSQLIEKYRGGELRIKFKTESVNYMSFKY